MGRLTHSGTFASSEPGGYSLVELLFVLAVLGVCMFVGVVNLTHGLHVQEARSAAQCLQAAVAAAQVSAVWRGDAVEVGCGAEGVSIVDRSSAHTLYDGACTFPVKTNVPRWRREDGVVLAFSGPFGSPDGSGSLYFAAANLAYRVVVRLESGLTARSAAESAGP